MKALAYKITCRTNTDAICVANHLEVPYDVPPDVRDGNSLILSKEYWDEEEINIEDIRGYVEDACAVYELDYTPNIEIVEYDFNQDE